MKRLLTAIPAVALFAGLLIFLWQRGFSAPESPRRGAPAAVPGAPDAGSPVVAPPAPPPGRPAAASKASLLIRVSGRGVPLPGAEVQLLREDQAGRMAFQTGSDGSRLIQQLPPGHYVASAVHPNFLRKEIHLDVAADLRTEASIDLQGGGRIRGRVTDRGAGPLQDVTVSLVDPATTFTLGPHLSAKTDVDGRYTLPPAPKGRFALRFVHEKFRTLDLAGFDLHTGLEDLTADAVLDLGARILGRVVDEQGAPVEGAELIIGNPNGGRIARSDVDGRFGVYGLTDEPVNGTASKKGYGTAYRRAIPANATDVEFRLARGGAVAGRIVVEPVPEHVAVSLSIHDEELGRPLRIATRSLTNPPGGAFRVEDLAPGLYWVEVEAEGYEALERPQVTIVPGQTAAGVTIRLRLK